MIINDSWYKWHSMLIWAFIVIITLQEICTIAASVKTAAICRILWRFLGPPLYILSIAVFFGITAIGAVICGILQRRDIKLPQYRVFVVVN